MYYPKQIPYLLDKEFKKNVEYTEYHIEELKDYCMCIWTMKSKKILDKTLANNILPDACVDIVIDFTNGTICFAGFSKETEPFQLKQNIDYMGVRLKPSIFYSLFHILNLQDTKERIEKLKQYLLQKTENKTEMQFVALVEKLYTSPKEKSVIEIAEKFGYHERHLYRVFKTNYGVAPKVLLNILRLHLCLTLMLEQNMDLVDIAYLCGFYDQSHFIKEIKKYTGISPLKMLGNYQ